MNVGRTSLESSQSLRVLAIGTSSWLEAAASNLAAVGVTVEGPHVDVEDRPDEPTVDCVLTDDPALAGAGSGVPTVVGIDGELPVEDLQDEPTTDVVTRTNGADASLLKHRLERTVELDTTTRTLDRRTERLRMLTETAPCTQFVVDDGGRLLHVDGRAFADAGIDLSARVGESIFDTFESNADVYDDVERALAGELVHDRVALADRVYETWYRPVRCDGSVTRVIVVVVDVTDRIRYERAISGLQEAVNEFVTATTKQEVFERVVDIGASVFDLENVAVFHFDDEENCLVSAASSYGFAEHVGRPLQMKSGDGIMWDVYVSETPRLYGDVQQSPDVHEKATRIHSSLYVPMADHGVLFAATPEPDQYDRTTFELTKLLGAATEAALDRIEWTEDLNERQRELEGKTERLAQLDRASRVREDVEKLLLRAESRQEIESGVCSRLAQVAECGFVWIGEPDPGGNQLLAREQAGLDRDYLKTVTVTTIDDPAAEPSGRTARTRRPTVVENVADAMRQGEWRTEALARDLQSVLSIPLVYDGYLYGVCSMYADGSDGFDDALVDTLIELGETIAYSIDTVKRKNALLNNDVTEVELHVDTASALVELSNACDAPVHLEGLIPGEDGSMIAFVTVEAVTTTETTDAIEAISDARVLRETENETLLQLRCSDTVLETFVESHGGWIRSLTVDGSETTVCIDVPESVEVRQALAELSRRGLDVSLVARRTRSDDGMARLHMDPRSDVLTKLTDRQREVVQSAYHGGFFEWPRETTGEEIAASLDISPPAFHNHVRAVERKLFASLFEQGVGE